MPCRWSQIACAVVWEKSGRHVLLLFSYGPNLKAWLPVSMYTVHQKFMQMAPPCARLGSSRDVERASTTLHCTHHVTHEGSDTRASFLCEMPSATRHAAVGVVGSPLPHVVRDALCEADGGIAEVRDQHGYPPSASAVRECSGDCRERSSSLF